MSGGNLLAVLFRPYRIWAVASVHAQAQRLAKLHRTIAKRFQIGDRVVYLGNVIGRGTALRETLAELLAFRRAIIAGPGMFGSDVIYLRGAQEEMLQKTLQVQFAASPTEVMQWMLDHGVAGTIEAYGGTPDEALRAVREGTMALTRWTGRLRGAMNEAPGHIAFMSALHRAACTQPAQPGDARALFVHAGVDVTRPLETQSDTFWWASNAFNSIDQPYAGFGTIVRGFDTDHPGIDARAHTLTVDAGCGFGGPLIAVCVTPAGEILEQIEA
jgi:hypothetical protein